MGASGAETPGVGVAVGTASADRAREPAPKDFWDKLSAFSAMAAAVFVPIAIAIVGHWYSDALKEREVKISEDTFKRQWVQLGLSILRDANTKDNLRNWAITIINSNLAEGLKMPDSIKEDFAKNGAILPPAVQTVTQTGASPSGDITLPTPTGRGALLDQLQTQALQHLLDHQLAEGIAVYDIAYRAWPIYRNVDEIRSFLRKQTPPAGAQLTDAQWKELYKKLDGFDLRGVNPDLLAKLKAAAQ